MHNGRTGFVYDALGNLIEKGSDYSYDSANNRTTVNPTTADYRRYTYDLFGRMTQVRALGADNTVVLLAEYVYDFRGMRIAKRKGTQITRYDLDEAGRNLEIQEDQGSRTTAWIGQKPLAVQDSGGTSWYVTDHQGTTAMMTDGNGKILWEDAANPFGIPAGSRGTVQSGVLFTGKIFDPDADMYYFNARWYNPETGRFASEDPARDGINWYAYVGNNPLKYTDPTGLKKKGGFWDKVKNVFEKIGDAFRNNPGGGDSSGANTSTPSSSGIDSSAPSDSDDNSSGGANKEPPEGINTLRDNSRANPPNHGSEDSRQALDASAVGDVKDDIANELPKGLDTDGSPKETQTKKSDKNIVRTDPWGIYAVKDGQIIVIKTGDDNAYGNRIYIKHEDGSTTLYAHLDSVGSDIKVGDTVTGGDKIGVMGSTGTKDRHLHLSYFKPDVESYVSSNTSDPNKFIEFGSRPANTKVSNTFGSDYHHKSVSKHEGIDYSGRQDNLLPGWQTLEWGKKEEED